MQIDRPIAIALFLFVIVLLIFFLVMPEYNKFKDLQSELGEKRAQYNAEFEYFSEIANLYTEIENRSEEIEKIDDALPVEPNFGNLVYYFQNQATANGLIIKSLFLSKSSPVVSKSKPLSMEESSSQKKMSDIVFSLNLMGGYSALENFIVSLEKSARLFEIQNISFGLQASSQESSQEQQFQKVETFSFSLQVATHSY